jgi:hypothetical protein
MKGFIKITDVNEQEEYLNIDYIIKFMPILNEEYKGNAIIYIAFGEKVSTLQTELTPEEIAVIIDLASK